MITLYNVKTKKNEELILRNNTLRMYVCGPTVYNSSHIGNIRPTIFFDVLARYIETQGYKIDYISNITDIDDKIINKAIENNCDYKTVSRKYADEYFNLLKELNIKYPKKVFYATDHIDEMTKLIKDLIKKDMAYEVDGDIFFKVKKVKDYGLISGQTTELLKDGVRIDVNDKKEDPLDFILWKKADTFNFKTSLSDGRPGWHTECAAINLKYFNDTIDIHGGGMDLKFPHHENENAQFVALKEKDLARFWVYVGFIDFQNAKMSKSKGNLILAKDLKKYADINSYRLLLLAHHYRQRINFSLELLEQYNKEYKKIVSTISKKHFETVLENIKTNDIIEEEIEKFNQSMQQDFATPCVVSQIFEIIKNINKEQDKKQVLIKINTAIKILNILGFDIKLKKYQKEDINLYKKWLLLKSEKNFKDADIIRDELVKKGII